MSDKYDSKQIKKDGRFAHYILNTVTKKRQLVKLYFLREIENISSLCFPLWAASVKVRYIACLDWWYVFKSFFCSKDELQYTLERKYIAGQKSYLFTRKSNRFKYRINFPHSKQANLDSNTVRDIIRRPLFVPIADVCFQR